MAIKPADNETFYREVDEELRKDQMTGFWKRYGILLVIGVFLLLLALAGFLWWQQQKQVRAGEQGEALTALFDDVQAGRTKGVDAKLNTLAEEGSPGYRAAALLTKGAMAVQSGNDAAAIAAFKQVAEDDGLPEPYRELALIRQTSVEYDTLAPAVVIQRLGRLAVAGNPWFGSAGELVAIAHLKQQRPQLAAPIFAAMAKDQALPPSMRSRALQMAGALGVDATQDAAPDGTDAGATKEVSQ